MNLVNLNDISVWPALTFLFLNLISIIGYLVKEDISGVERLLNIAGIAASMCLLYWGGFYSVLIYKFGGYH